MWKTFGLTYFSGEALRLTLVPVNEPLLRLVLTKGLARILKMCSPESMSDFIGNGKV